jgi:hypothetical protein
VNCRVQQRQCGREEPKQLIQNPKGWQGVNYLLSSFPTSGNLRILGVGMWKGLRRRWRSKQRTKVVCNDEVKLFRCGWRELMEEASPRRQDLMLSELRPF